jgi:alpha-L-arabinofuranosidase
MRRLLLLMSVTLTAIPQGVAAPAAHTDAVVEIDASRPAPYQIPRTIFGTFLEPIGRSIYGGLWAQILENPSFEDNLWSARQVRDMLSRQPALESASDLGLPLPWEPLDSAQGVRYEPRWGDAANSARSLLVMGLAGRQTGVRQEVYLPVHRILRYEGSVYVKPLSGPAELEISIRKRNRPQDVLARARVAPNGHEWQRYSFTLELQPGGLGRLEAADFVIALNDNSRALIDQAILFPADAIDGMDPEMIALAREMKTPVVRYGGNFTSGYHWRDGVGPMDQRRSMLNQSWGMPEYNHFGTDEFLRFCKLINAEPQIALNLGSGTPEEAAEWVAYVNERQDGRSGGLLWELGNELWGDWQIGYPPLEEAAARTRAFSEAVRKVDPRARLIATGQDPDHFREWNTALLSSPPGTFDYLSTHFVVGAHVQQPHSSPGFVAQASFALPVGLERHLREMKAQIDADERWRGRVKIAFTEWLFHAGDDRVPRFNNLGGAICTAGFLNALMRVADFTPIADMTGLMEFGGIWKKHSQVYGVPAYWAFRMYAAAAASQPVETATKVETYSIEKGNHRIPEIANVPYLDVVAALGESGGKLTLFCVNRDMNRDLPTRFRLAGFHAGPHARVTTLAGSSIYDANDEINPEAVIPRETSAAVGESGFEHTFPRASVTVIELSARRP